MEGTVWEEDEAAAELGMGGTRSVQEVSTSLYSLKVKAHCLTDHKICGT